MATGHRLDYRLRVSFDLCAFFPKRHLSNEEAARLYHAACDGKVSELESELVATPALRAFHDELCALHPQIDDIPEDRLDDHEYCPWSIAHDVTDWTVIMCCVWSRADYVHDLVHRLARTHGLAVFDPQESVVIYADGSTG